MFRPIRTHRRDDAPRQPLRTIDDFPAWGNVLAALRRLREEA
jgi:hypothetical protein